MNKVSLLAASVALALTGCGSDDSGTAAAPVPGGIMITGFDGYFNQAVAFQDTNNNGVLDFDSSGKVTGDILFGLTNSQGQIEVPQNIEGAIALQTITPGGVVQTKLISGYPNVYAGKYTIDMDHPAQAMAHELVFRAPTSSEVISPITDLVAIEMAKSTDAVPVSEEEAIALVNTALGGTEEAPIDLYADFVSGDDASAELHKTAQILTESKAANPVTYEEKSAQFAEKADKVVDSIVADPTQDIADPNLKPVIIDNGDVDAPLVPEIITNDILIVDKDITKAAQEALTKLDIKVGTSFGGANILLRDSDLNPLFSDGDLSGSNVVVTLVPNQALTDAGVGVTYESDALELVSTEAGISNSGSFTIELQAFDTNSKPALSKTPTKVIFDLNIESANELPQEVVSEKNDLQAAISSDWHFQVGTPITNMTLDMSGLFTDKEQDQIKLDATLLTEYRNKGIFAEFSKSNPTLLTISGEPTAIATGSTLSIHASDDQHSHGQWTTIDFNLPGIEEGTLPPVVTHPLENKNWYILEHGSSDGDSNDSNDYSRIWCDTYRFEDYKVLINKRTLANRQTCSTAVDDLVQEESGTYIINGDNNIIATFTFEEDNDDGKPETITETTIISIKGDTNAPTDNISQGAKSILYTNTGDEEGQFEYSSAIYFADKADAEKRINVLSSGNAESRDAPIYWPGEKDGEYILTSTSLQMGEAGNDHGNAHDSDYITFWVNGVSCDGLFSQSENGDPAIFERFTVTSDSISSDDQYNEISAHGACLTMMEGEEGEVQTPNAVIPFIFGNDYPLIQGETYSIMGDISDHWSKYISDINFNMTWDGKTNNE